MLPRRSLGSLYPMLLIPYKRNSSIFSWIPKLLWPKSSSIFPSTLTFLNPHKNQWGQKPADSAIVFSSNMSLKSIFSNKNSPAALKTDWITKVLHPKSCWMIAPIYFITFILKRTSWQCQVSRYLQPLVQGVVGTAGRESSHSTSKYS